MRRRPRSTAYTLDLGTLSWTPADQGGERRIRRRSRGASKGWSAKAGGSLAVLDWSVANKLSGGGPLDALGALATRREPGAQPDLNAHYASLGDYIAQCVTECPGCALLPFPLNLACCAACMGDFGLSSLPEETEPEPIQTGECTVTVVPGQGSLLGGEITLENGSTLWTTYADFGNFQQCVPFTNCRDRYASRREPPLEERISVGPGIEGSASDGRLGPGAYVRAPAALREAFPRYRFGEYSPESDHSGPRDRIRWLYLSIDAESVPAGCERSTDTWWVTTLRSAAPLYLVSASIPFAAYDAAFGIAHGRSDFRVSLWVGVMHWVVLLGTGGDIPSAINGTLGGRIVGAMSFLGETQAWVNWKANPDLHPDLTCGSHLEYFQSFPCRSIPIWDEIEDGGGSDQPGRESVPGLGEDGQYGTPGDSGYFALRRPALSFAGLPVGANGPLYSALGRMVKAEALVPVDTTDADGLPVSRDELAAAQVAFNCVFGGRASAGVSLHYRPSEDDESNTVRAQTCLTVEDLTSLDAFVDFVAGVTAAVPWLVESFDAEQLLLDREGR